MGTNIGPSYACLFMGYLEENMFKSYRGPTADLYKRFIDDIIGASSLPQEHLEQFIQYMQSFHPAIEYTLNITHKKQLPFLDTEMTPTDDDTMSTSVYDKETDSSVCAAYAQMTLISMRKPKNRFSSSSIKDIPKYHQNSVQ